MPKKRNQKLYQRGGDFRGEGGFGCVFDAADLLSLMEDPSVDVAFENFDVVRKRGNSNSNNNNSNANSNNNNAEVDAETGMASLRDDLKHKVAKVFVSPSAYNDEKNEIANIKRFFKTRKADYGVYFPNVHQCGFVTWKRGNLKVEQTIMRSLPCKMIGKGLQVAEEAIHTLFFIIMDRLDYSLDDVLKKKAFYTNKKMDIARFVLMLQDLVMRMKEMHEYGIVHCDIKPQNILADTNGVLYFVDLGSVRHTEVFGKQGTSSRSRRYSIVFSGNAEIERHYDEELLLDLDDCLKYLVCKLLGIKNISTLIAAFRKKKEDAEKSDDVKVKEDMLLYVDNFAMAITVMMFIKQFVDDKVGRGKNMQNLENIVRDLFMNVGSVTLELDPKDKFKSVKEIGQRCEKFYNANARVKEMMNNVNVDEEGNYIGPAVQYVPKVARPQDLAALGKQFIF